MAAGQDGAGYVLSCLATSKVNTQSQCFPLILLQQWASTLCLNYLVMSWFGFTLVFSSMLKDLSPSI